MGGRSLLRPSAGSALLRSHKPTSRPGPVRSDRACPDLAPFRAKMEPAYKRIAEYAGEANVKKFRDMVEQGRKTE